MDWVNAYVSVWTELQAYIKQHHTTGLSWSKTVSHIIRLWQKLCRLRYEDMFIMVSQGPVASASGAAPRGGAPAPPPPGPPPPMDFDKPSGGDSGPVNRNALFASINKGADITRGTTYLIKN